MLTIMAKVICAVEKATKALDKAQKEVDRLKARLSEAGQSVKSSRTRNSGKGIFGLLNYNEDRY